MTTLPDRHDTTPAYRELHAAVTGHWQHLATQPRSGLTPEQATEKAASHTARLYERIVIDGQNAEHLRLRAEHTLKADLDEATADLRGYVALVRQIQAHAARHRDEPALRALERAIARFNQHPEILRDGLPEAMPELSDDPADAAA